jgi:hypothetical protein
LVSGGRESERAQLWSIYFGMLAASNPPPFLARARDELKEHLEGGPPPPSMVISGRGRLWRVK